MVRMWEFLWWTPFGRYLQGSPNDTVAILGNQFGHFEKPAGAMKSEPSGMCRGDSVLVQGLARGTWHNILASAVFRAGVVGWCRVCLHECCDFLLICSFPLVQSVPPKQLRPRTPSVPR